VGSSPNAFGAQFRVRRLKRDAWGAAEVVLSRGGFTPRVSSLEVAQLIMTALNSE